MARNVHLAGSSRITRRSIRVTVHKDAGLVVFREFKRRRAYALPLEHWIGLGFDRAVAVAAAAERQQRIDARRAAQEVRAGSHR